MTAPPKVVRAKYPGTCRACEGRYAAGDRIVQRTDKRWIHEACRLHVVTVSVVAAETPTLVALCDRAIELQEAKAVVARLEAEVEHLRTKAVQEGIPKPAVNRHVQAAIDAHPVVVR